MTSNLHLANGYHRLALYMVGASHQPTPTSSGGGGKKTSILMGLAIQQGFSFQHPAFPEAVPHSDQSDSPTLP